jgi:virulence factor Mce-like protein
MSASVTRREPSFWRPYVIAGAMILGLVLATYFAFHPRLPFSTGYRVDAVFTSSNGLRDGSPVRVAGVEVGKVVEIDRGPGATTVVTMELGDHGRPVHRDATARIRPRVFLEGGFMVELRPGSPSAPELPDRGTIPLPQTAVPVQLHQVLTAFDAPARESLRSTLDATAQALSGGGARGLRRLAPQLAPVLRDTAWVAQAAQGEQAHDLSGLVRATDRLARGLDRGPALGDLVGNLATTVDALHDRDRELAAGIRETGRVLAAAPRALRGLDEALPVVDDSVRQLTPALRSAPRALAASTRRLRELGTLVAPARHDVTVAALETALRDLPIAVARLGELFPDVKPVTDCLSSHVVPLFGATVPDGTLSTGRPVWQDFVHGLTGLSSASQNFDGNGYALRYQFALDGSTLSTATVPGLGQLVTRAPANLRSRPLPRPDGRPPVQDPDAPCSEQPRPSLDTPSGSAGFAPVPEDRAGKPHGEPLSPDNLRRVLDRKRLRRSLEGAR